MPKKYFEDQFDDEEVLLFFRKHPIVMRKGIIWFAVGMLLPVMAVFLWTFLPVEPPSLTLFFGSIGVGFLLGMLLFSPAYISWYFSVFIVTNQRFIQITQKGMFNRQVSDLGLDHIQTVNYEIRGLEQTMLGFGTIMLQTMLGDLVIHNVHKPAHTQKDIVAILRDEGFALKGDRREDIDNDGDNEN